VDADLRLMLAGMSRDGAVASTYLELPEFYGGTSRKLAPVQVVAGRKLEHWSHLDEQWRLGIWQPRFRWDYVHPEAVGLTGVFLRVEQPLFKIVAWASPIFVPERGVQFSSEGGSFESGSRWFVPPPGSVKLINGKETPIHYQLMMPEMSELINHAGASIMARVGRDQGPWGSVGFAHKPVNQLLLASSNMLRQAATADGIHGDAKIYPRVIYHDLVSFEGGYESERLSAWVSMLGERPMMDATPGDWTAQQAEPALALSSTADFSVWGSGDSATRVDLSWLSQWGGNAGDQGRDAAGGASSQFEARYPYQHALAAGLRSGIFSRVLASTRLLYDVSHQGTIWSTEVRYQPRPSWMVGIGADLLYSQRGDDPQGADLIGRFNANDRVHAGVSYVF
jgi:hypothetical protein